MDAFSYANWRCFTGDGSAALFEFIPALFAHHQLVFAPGSFLIRAHKPVPQYGELNRFAGAAFLCIHGRFQPVFHKSHNGRFCLLCFLLAFGVNAEIIGIANPPAGPLFQLFVQFMQQNVGQEWRSGAALRYTFSAFGELAVDWHRGAEPFADKAQGERPI